MAGRWETWLRFFYVDLLPALSSASIRVTGCKVGYPGCGSPGKEGSTAQVRKEAGKIPHALRKWESDSE